MRVHIEDLDDGTYLCTYRMTKRGQYALALSMNGVPIVGSPFTIKARPPAPLLPVHEYAKGAAGCLTRGLRGDGGRKGASTIRATARCHASAVVPRRQDSAPCRSPVALWT